MFLIYTHKNNLFFSESKTYLTEFLFFFQTCLIKKLCLFNDNIFIFLIDYIFIKLYIKITHF